MTDEPDPITVTIKLDQPIYVFGRSTVTIGKFGYDENGKWCETFRSYDADHAPSWPA